MKISTIKLNTIAFRRSMIILFLVLMGLFGGNIDGPNPSRSESNIYELGTSEKYYKLPILTEGRVGEIYRVSFRARALTRDNIDVREAGFGVVLGNELPATTINIYVTGQGTKEQIGSASLKAGTEYAYLEKVFVAKTAFREVLIERVNNQHQTVVNVQSPIISRLEVKSIGKVNELAPTEVINITNAESLKQEDSADNLYTFIGKSKEVAQVFSPIDSNITEIDLKLRFKSTGGTGSYTLTLAKVLSKSGDKIAYERITTTSFNVQSKRITSGGEEFYRLPLTARVEKAGQYLLIISNTGVQSNLVHNLSIFGTKDHSRYLGGDAIAISGDGRYETIGDMYFSLRSAKIGDGATQEYGNNQIIEDVGTHKLLSYSPRNDSISLLDISKIQVPSYLDSTSVGFNNDSKAIVGKAVEGVSFTYQVSSKQLFSNFTLTAELIQPNGGQTVVSYSTNRVNWTELETELAGTEISAFEDILPSNNLYVQVSYRGENANNAVFGLKKLIIQMEIQK